MTNRPLPAGETGARTITSEELPRCIPRLE